MAVIQNPKYDNDYVTLGYLKSSMETNTTETDKKINEIPKNYNSPPVPPYYQNSLLLLNGQIYKCIKSRLVGSFNMSDWKIVVETNDLDEALKTIYDVNKLEYVDQEDGLIETFYQESDPSLNWETDLAKNLHASDLWTTDMVNCYQYEKKKTNPISFGWKKVSVPISLFDIVDGYRRIFTVKPDNYSKDDLWIDKKTKIAINSSEIYQENDWEERDDFIESSKIEQEEYHKIYLLPKITEINRQTKAEIKKAVDEIILSVSQTYTTKTEIEKYVDDIKTEVSEEYTTKEDFNAQMSITSTQLNQIVEKTTTQGNEIDTLNQEYAKINMTSNQIVEQVANFTNDIEKIIKSSNGSNYIEISDAFEGNPIYFSFYGNIHYLYPGANIYPGANTFTRDSYLSIEYENSSTKMRLPYFDLNYTENVYDEFVIDGTKAYIIRRLNSDLQPLENEKIEELGNVSIPLKNGYNKLKMESFNLNYYIKYNVQNNYTNSFATKAELKITEDAIKGEVSKKADDKEIKGLISTIAGEIELEVKKKVDNSEYTHAKIVAKINDDTSEVLIDADKINITANDVLNLIAGNELNLTSKNMTIVSDNFNVDKYGNVKIQDEGQAGNTNLTIISNENQTYQLKNLIRSDGIFMSNGNQTLPDSLIYMSTVGTGRPQISLSYYKNNSDENLSLSSSYVVLRDGTSETTIIPSGITTPTLTQTSLATSKKNFEKLENALEIISNTDIYKYHLKSQNDDDKKHIGFVIGNKFNYSKDITSEKNDGVDIYSMVSVCLQAIKELNNKIEILEEKICQ